MKFYVFFSNFNWNCFPAPPGPPVIRSESSKVLLDYTEPVTEGGSLTMICETIGGDPLPRVSWWRGTRLIDDIVDEVDSKSSRVRNSLRVVNLQRKDQGERLTCKASNTNLTEPVETSIAINMVCKLLFETFWIIKMKIVCCFTHRFQIFKY